MTEPTKAVFLSYASQDAAAAQRICEALRTGGIEVWFDQSELRGGDVWDQKIKKQIRDCAIFIPIISVNTVVRHEGYFRLEWDLADQRTHRLARNRAFIVPVALDATPDARADVPESFLRVQWTRLPAGETPLSFVERVSHLLSLDTHGTPALLQQTPPQAQSWPAGGWGIAQHGVPEKSIAVMPFASLSGEKESEYFSDGLAEEILNALSQVEELSVAARSSAFSFKGKATEVSEIASRLHVATVLEGSVRRWGNRVRVTVQLVDARNGFQLWSERYDREMADVFEIQDDIARSITNRLKVGLFTGVPRPTANMEAYDLYLQGRHHLIQRSPTSLHTAVQYFERCIGLDPNYALAHAGLVDCYGVLPFRGLMPHAAAQARAQTAMKKAIELASELWECIYSRALYLMYFEGNWSEADRYFKRALEINSRTPMVNAHYAALHSTVGREAETVRSVEAACRLDPLAAQVHGMGSMAMVNLGKFAEGEALARHALELQPDHLFALFRHAFALSGLERHAEAVATMERVVALSRTPIFTGVLGLLYARAGRHEDAQRSLQELKDRAARGEFSIAIARLALELGSNDRERVRKALAAAAAEGAQGYHIKIASGPFIEPYRIDPEIDRLHRRLYGL